VILVPGFRPYNSAHDVSRAACFIGNLLGIRHDACYRHHVFGEVPQVTIGGSLAASSLIS